MKLHRNAKTTPTSRLELVRRAVYDGWRYQAVAEGYGVSVRTVAKWVQRFRQLGVAGLEDGSSRPQQTPHITPPIRVTFIRQLREHHGLPAWVIARALRMPRLAGRSSRPDLRRVSRAGHHLVCRAPHHDPSRHERQREWLCVPGLSRRLCRSDASPSTDTALHATDHGKAERFIQTLLREWAYVQPYATSGQRRRALRPWLHYYNHDRPHASLNYEPPSSRLQSAA